MTDRLPDAELEAIRKRCAGEYTGVGLAANDARRLLAEVTRLRAAAAPVGDEGLVERAAESCFLADTEKAPKPSLPWNELARSRQWVADIYRHMAHAALAAIAPELRRRGREEAIAELTKAGGQVDALLDGIIDRARSLSAAPVEQPEPGRTYEDGVNLGYRGGYVAGAIQAANCAGAFTYGRDAEAAIRKHAKEYEAAATPSPGVAAGVPGKETP